MTVWNVAHQAPLSMGFSRQEHRSGLSCPPLVDLPEPEIKPTSPVSPALHTDSLPTEPCGKPPPYLKIPNYVSCFSKTIRGVVTAVIFSGCESFFIYNLGSGGT